MQIKCILCSKHIIENFVDLRKKSYQIAYHRSGTFDRPFSESVVQYAHTECMDQVAGPQYFIKLSDLFNDTSFCKICSKRIFQEGCLMVSAKINDFNYTISLHEECVRSNARR